MIRPVLIVQADQYGIAHAPFAPARAYLSEHGYTNCYVLVHSRYCTTKSDDDDVEKEEDGSCIVVENDELRDLQLLQVRVDHLVPDSPNMGGGILNCLS
mmetsp:Transcript_11960/g.17429  ORF Transcript_11960/g.17429 Transcript_11960/m.17429 type:complete len:99 (+) Transcript_11960:1-297(+)